MRKTVWDGRVYITQEFSALAYDLLDNWLNEAVEKGYELHSVTMRQTTLIAVLRKRYISFGSTPTDSL